MLEIRVRVITKIGFWLHENGNPNQFYEKKRNKARDT